MWSTDYPHPACTWPDSRKLVDEEFAGIPDDERELIVCGNAERGLGPQVTTALPVLASLRVTSEGPERRQNKFRERQKSWWPSR